MVGEQLPATQHSVHQTTIPHYGEIALQGRFVDANYWVTWKEFDQDIVQK